MSHQALNASVSSTKRLLKIIALTCIAALSSCGYLQDRRDENKGIQLQSLKVPAGYQVRLFASDLPKARHMVMGTQGTLFLGSTAGNVYALTLDGDKVLKQRTIIKGMAPSGGIAFKDGSLYVSDRTRVMRFDEVESNLGTLKPPRVVLDGFPDKARHSSLTMAFGPDGKLYVSVGSPCDSCEAVNDEYGIILRSNPDGTGREVVARGLRNSVGFDWHPQTKELWFTDNGPDGLGIDRPNDELNKISKTGENFGFPYCHDKGVADPTFGAKRPCSDFTAPVFGLQAHVAALGMKFDPTTPNNGSPSILVARHGSHPPTRVGYDVVRVTLQNGQLPQMEPFLSGFLQGTRYWGRPVDIFNLKNGSILVSDDLNGALYHISRR